MRASAQCWFLLAAALLTPRPAASESALERYVAAHDPAFRYELVKTIRGRGYTQFVLDLVSQTWRTPAEVDRTEWRHWVTIIKPERVRGETGLLFIAGGSNNGRAPVSADAGLIAAAAATQSVAVELRMVPNQPLTFAGETRPRSEDSLIAYTWDRFLRVGDERWPAQFPMTKSAVRAMDAATAFLASEGVAQNRFVVAGGSKRGWTAWLTAAVDARVAAVVPIVIDLLNMEPSFEHHHRAYGFFSPAIRDYERMGIMDWAGHPRYRELVAMVDPYAHRDRLTMPKFLINATGDEFFLLDSSQFYFHDLSGEKHLRYVPNTGHSLAKSDARESMVAFYDAVLRDRPRPEYSWKFMPDGGIELRTAAQPAGVRLWQATNPNARDFRITTIGLVWSSSPLKPVSRNTYTAKLDPPPTGFTAYFIEMTFDGGGKFPFKFTTGVRVVPGSLPHGPYRPKLMEKR
jgi:PhoPQ-activated pathogenicity-related protein